MVLRRNFDDAELIGVASCKASAQAMCEDDWMAAWGERGKDPDRVMRWDEDGAYVKRGKRRVDLGYEIERTTVQ